MKRKLEDSKEESEKKERKIEKTKDVDDVSALTILLAKTKVEDLPSKGKKLITCHRDDSLRDCVKKLSENKVSSLVVLTNTGLFYGFVDILDVVKYVVDLAGEGTLTKSEFDLEKLEEFNTATIRHVINNSDSDDSDASHPTLLEGQSLLSAVEILKTGIHRVAVVDKDRNPLQIVTQSGVVKFLHQHLDSLGDKQKHDLGSMGDQFIISIVDTERTIDAFKIIKICRVSAVAVVNKAGKLVGNVSANDLSKTISNSGWVSKLFLQVGKFASRPPISLQRGDTLADALKEIVENKVHRIFVVDSENKPRTVVALTDILREVTSEETK